MSFYHRVLSSGEIIRNAICQCVLWMLVVILCFQIGFWGADKKYSGEKFTSTFFLARFFFLASE